MSDLPKVNIREIMHFIDEQLMMNGIYVEKGNSDEINLHAFMIQEQLESLSEVGKQVFRISDLLSEHDISFIVKAYMIILKRKPDKIGLEHYLGKLRSGKYSKVDIIARLLFSKEAKRHQVKIKGLLLPFVVGSIYKLPLIGYAFRLLTLWIRLPKIVKDLREYNLYVSARFSNYDELLESISRNNEQIIVELKQQLSTKADIQSLYNIEKRVEDIVKSLESENPPLLDELYVAFEDKYRGTREDIKNRQNVYIPLIKKVTLMTDSAPILDIGCGRGEWLELLGENNLAAKGIDINKVMIQKSQQLDLEVELADAIEYLKKVDDESLSAVTGFHIIEHIPFKSLLLILDECYRVLKPGGIILFETPNPESIFVGSYGFWYDPTHINPLVPDTIMFLSEQRGFSNVETLRLHKRSEPEYTGQKFVDEIIYKMNMEQDFAIIGYKPILTEI